MHIYDKNKNLKAILDFKDEKSVLTWNPRSWVDRLRWKLRMILKDLLP